MTAVELTRDAATVPIVDAADRPAARTTEAPTGFGSGRGGLRRWLRPDRVALIAVTSISLAFNSWALSLNGLGNQYYAAAARSMSMSWRNFFFASLDQGGFISVDKPPLALWVEALSARAFGINTWSLILPSAIAGSAAVALLWCTIRRRFGVPAATVAALVLALSPVNVAVNRLNLPEPFLILCLVAAVWALLRALDSPRAMRWLALSGAFVGLAFNIKMLAAYIVVPALGLALVMGTAGWWNRVRRAAWFGSVALAASAPWVLAVDRISAATRPYVGGSTNNTVWDLVIGYNGFGRVNGTSGIGGGGGLPGGGGIGSAMSGVGGILGGSAGPLRLLSDALGGQIAWLLPLAAFGAIAGLSQHRRDRSRRAAVVLWVGWLALYAVVFSLAEGTFHAYYTSLMTPGLAALVGIGAASLVPLMRTHLAWLWALLTVGLATLVLQLQLVGRLPEFYGWVRWPMLVVALAAVAGIARAFVTRRSRRLIVALGVGLAGLLIAPTAWAASETSNAVLNSTLPQAGPRSGVAGSSFGSVSSNGDPALAAWLSANDSGQRWQLAVANAQSASGLIADQDISVMALGGFMGTDAASSVDDFADAVAAGQVRYVLSSGSGFANRGGGGGGGMGGGTASQIIAAVTSTCTALTTGSTGGTLPAAYSGLLYDCSSAAEAIRAAG